MNSILILIIAVSVLGSCIALWWVVFQQSPRLALSEARLELFLLRDELFEMADRGEIEMDSPAHHIVRALLNTSIRFAHDLSAIRLALLALLHRDGSDTAKFEKALEEALREVSPQARQRLKQILTKMNYWLIVQMVKRSFILSVGTATIAACIGAARAWRRFRAGQPRQRSSGPARAHVRNEIVKAAVYRMPIDKRQVREEVESELLACAA